MLSAEPKAEADNNYRYWKSCIAPVIGNHALRPLLEIMHCARNLQISQVSASR